MLSLQAWITHLILVNEEMMYWPVTEEISFKHISIFSSGGHVFSQVNCSDHFCTILLEGIMRNNSVK